MGSLSNPSGENDVDDDFDEDDDDEDDAPDYFDG